MSIHKKQLWRWGLASLWLVGAFCLPVSFLQSLALSVGALGFVCRQASFQAGLGLLVVLSLLSLSKPAGLGQFIDSLDYKVREAFYQVRGPLKPSGDVVIVDIDNKSLAALGQWPFPRTLLANMVENCTRDGAKVIAFDVIFSEPDRLSLHAWLRRLDAMGMKLGFEVNPDLSGSWVHPDKLARMVVDAWVERFQKNDPNYALFSQATALPTWQEAMSSLGLAPAEQSYLDWDRARCQSAHYSPPADWQASAIEHVRLFGQEGDCNDVLAAQNDYTSFTDMAKAIAKDVPDFAFMKVDWDKAFSEGATRFCVSQEAVRQIALEDWRTTIGQSVDEARMDTDDELIQNYINWARKNWLRDENILVDKAKLASNSYEARPFQMRETPLVEMAQLCKNLFYLDRDPLHKPFGPCGLILDNDKRFASAISNCPVVLGGMLILDDKEEARLLARTDFSDQLPCPRMLPAQGIKQVDAAACMPYLRRGVKQILNVADLQKAASSQGIFNIVPDISGSARNYSLMMWAPRYQTVLNPAKKMSAETQINWDIYPSICLEMLRKGAGSCDLEIAAKNNALGIQVGEYFIPVDYKGEILINFMGAGGPKGPDKPYESGFYFPYVSVVDAILGRFPEGTFKDKYVLLGSTDSTLHGHVGSPFVSSFPGLEVHATMLDNILTKRYLQDVSESYRLVSFLALLFGGLALVFALSYAKLKWSLPLAFGLLIALPCACYFAMTRSYLCVDFVYYWLSILTLSLLVWLLGFWEETKARSFVTAQFSQMVSPQILDRLQQEPEAFSLRGQRAQVSVMFSDLAGFTSISEKLAPQELVALLNRYFTPMTDIILARDGFIDKFIGDAIMAVWGVPYTDKDHAKKAALACLEQQEKLDSIFSQISKDYGVKIASRMGLASGEVSAALVGSDYRRNYTVMGDVVNFAARLEPACKDYGVRILMSQATFEDCQDYVDARCLDRIVVKGKTEAIAIYELAAKKGQLDPQKAQGYKLFEEGLRLHWERKWDEAEEQLHAAQYFIPNDVATQNLLARIANYRNIPPPPAWRGERNREQKG